MTYIEIILDAANTLVVLCCNRLRRLVKLLGCIIQVSSKFVGLLALIKF